MQSASRPPNSERSSVVIVLTTTPKRFCNAVDWSELVRSRRGGTHTYGVALKGYQYIILGERERKDNSHSQEGSRRERAFR